MQEKPSPVTEATDGGLEALIGLVKCSCLEVLVVARQQLSMKSVALWAAVFLTPLGFVELFV